MTIRGPIPDQEENQFSSLRPGPTGILVNTSSFSQFSLEALVGVKVEFPGRHTCSRFGSLTRASIQGGANTQVEKGNRKPSRRKRSVGDMDWLSIRWSTMDQREEFYRSSRLQKTNEARSFYGRDQQATTVNEYIPSITSVINSRANFIRGEYLC